MRMLTEQSDRTTDALAIDGAIWAVPENSAVRVSLNVIARGLLPNTGRAYFSRNAVISRQGEGAPTLDAADALVTVANAGAAGWTVAPAFSGNNIVLRLTGAAGVVVDWAQELDGVLVGPIA